MARRDWESAAACAGVGPGPWDSVSGWDAAEAMRICRTTCTVRQACLDAAMAEEDGQPVDHRAGIRGGLGPRERHALARRRTQPSGRPP